MGQGQSGATASSSVPMAETGAGDRRRRRRRRDDSDSDSDSEYDIERGPEKETPAQVRPPPPHVSASAVLGGEKEVTKEMYGEAAPDDELSPAMLMRLQRIREERRRKEMDRDAQRRKEQEYPMIYGDACTGSNEFNSMIYALFKMAFYCAFLGICIAIITYDYQLTPCREFGNECLYSDVSKMCVATSGSDACRIECINSGLPFAEAGCEVLTTPPHTVTCIGNFRAQCITRLTCPARPNKEVRSGLKYAAATLGILAIMELLYGIAMMITKSMHVSDFSRLSMFQKGVVIYVRVWGTASQVMWFVGIVANIYIFYVWNKYTGMCSDAVTTDGSKYRFFNDVLYLAIALLLYHFVTLALGTFFRARLPLRGTLYRPSTDAEILVPLGLDCRSCRSRARPRWFPCFKKHMRKENCTGCCCNCTSCMIDTFCCLTFEWFGLCLEKFWRHRHFIGP